MQIEKMYNELCELFQKIKNIYPQLNKASMDLDVVGWNNKIKELNHIQRQINIKIKDIDVLKNKNFEEMKRNFFKNGYKSKGEDSNQ